MHPLQATYLCLFTITISLSLNCVCGQCPWRADEAQECGLVIHFIPARRIAASQILAGHSASWQPDPLPLNEPN